MVAIVSWIKRPVVCANCDAPFLRRLFRPKDSTPITNFFCDKKCKGKWQMDQKPYGEAWLRQKYEVERLTAPDIAKIVGRNSKQVWHWLKGYGIQTRSRGSYEHLHFVAGGPGSFTGCVHTPEAKAKLRAARLADGHFPKDNGRPYWEGKVGDRHPSWTGGCTPERQALYASRQWKDACKATWHRADAKCERCGLDSRLVISGERRFAIHHVVSFKVRELRAELSNLRLLCRTCHLHIHSRANTTSELLRAA